MTSVPENVDQFDHQNRHDQHFEHERAGLVKFVDHELIEFARSL